MTTDLDITGTWRLVAWRRYSDDGTFFHPFGDEPEGILVYTPDGFMAVQMVRADRPTLDTDNAIGGSVEERAGAYSTCLSYFGRYRIGDDHVVHLLDGSLFPNWSDTAQVRPFRLDDGDLVLEVRDPSGRITNEIAWRRPAVDRAARLARFVNASVRLTGFDHTELIGTGVADGHLDALEAAVPRAIVAELLNVLGGDESDDPVPDDAVAACLARDDLGPVARNLIVAWYTGTWHALPPEWHDAQGGDAGLDETHVVSSAAFLAGLQWQVAEAHAPGGDAQGFGAWATAPNEVGVEVTR